MCPHGVRGFLFDTDEIQLLIVVSLEPHVASSHLHGNSCVTSVRLLVGVKPVVGESFTSDPEPQIQSAGVAQSEPDVVRVGHLGSRCDQLQLASVGDGDQVFVVLSAVDPGVLPGLILSDQDHSICQEQTQPPMRIFINHKFKAQFAARPTLPLRTTDV